MQDLSLSRTERLGPAFEHFPHTSANIGANKWGSNVPPSAAGERREDHGIVSFFSIL